MPPRRGRKAQPRPSHPPPASPAPPSATSLIPPTLDVQIAQHISEWDESGTEALHALILSQLSVAEEAATSTMALSTIPLLHIIITLLKANVDVRELTGIFEGLLDELEDERRDVLGEALVDAVEVLEEERENLGEENQAKEGEEEETPRGITVLKFLLESNTLPVHIPNLLLAPSRLLSLGLHPMPRNPKGLHNALVKKNTTLFFKQRKFNLLRESSEGFSGLIVLLTSDDSVLPKGLEESDEERKERARRVWGKLMRLIGYFNLSPPRVLDIIMEIASCHVAEHWQFFLELLRCSPWGNVQEVKGKGKEKEETSWKEEEIHGIEQVMDRGGDRVLSQVLGFKLGFYRKLEAGDTPVGLIYIAALLIKYGFVSLTDLLPFLSPDDTEMETIRKKWASSLSARSGPSNALTMAVLDDDEPASSTDAAQNDDTPQKPPPEQRVQITHALLAIGDKSAVEYMLGRWPWIAQKSVEVADLILGMVEAAVEPVYQDTVKPSDDYDLGAAIPSYGGEKAKEQVMTLSAPIPPETSTTTFKFFYPHADDASETWSSIEDIHSKGLRWLGLVRGLGGRRSRLMVKFCRIAVAHLEGLRQKKMSNMGIEGTEPTTPAQIDLVQPTPDELRPWLDLLRIVVLPSLSCSSASAAFDVELWHLLKIFPYTVRYSLYGEWRDSTCDPNGRNPCLVAAHAAAMTTKEVQKALRRVTSTSSSAAGPTAAATQSERQSARNLAKQSHGNPMFVWTTAVTQVKAYPNIGEAIVNAGRYMTQLSYDVATFVMLDTLSDDKAQRLNEMGTGVAFWLERLSKFVGDFNRRYMNMDLFPVLQYIINRLMRGHSGDLIILEKLMSSMSGVEPIPNDGVSETQLQAYAGGRELVREAFSATRIQIQAPPEPGLAEQAPRAPVEKVKNLKKSLPRLVNALREQGLAMPIWIALAQTRQAVVDKLADTPIKAMNLVQDNCHNTFIQFGDFLVEHLSSEEHISLTPDLEQLVVDFGLEYGMAFQILRPRLNAEIERIKLEEKAAVQARLDAAKKAMSKRDQSATPLLQPKTVNGGSDAEMGSPATPSTPPLQSISTPGANDDVSMMEDGGHMNSIVPPPKTQGGKGKGWWLSALTVTMQQARRLLPTNANDVMSAPFFVIFWHLTTQDIAFSPESYDMAIKAIDRQISTVQSYRVNQRDKAKVNEQKDELARLKARADVLKKEQETHANVHAQMKRRMRTESQKWFGKPITEKQNERMLAVQLYQYCFYPRAILSPCDAVFVAKFVRMAHDLGTDGYSIVFVYNMFFNDSLAACIFSCTDSEARNLGRCLALLMADLDKWHQSEEVYLKEAVGISKQAKEGEEQKKLPGMLFRPKRGDELRIMTWAEFRTFYAKCHNILTRALISCWRDAEFMHNRNAIIVALQVINSFPIMETNGEEVENAVKKLQSGEAGEIPSDLKMMCTSFLSGLKRRQQSRPFVPPASFGYYPRVPVVDVPPISMPIVPPQDDNVGPRSPPVLPPALSPVVGAKSPSPAPATPDPDFSRDIVSPPVGKTSGGTTPTEGRASLDRPLLPEKRVEDWTVPERRPSPDRPRHDRMFIPRPPPMANTGNGMMLGQMGAMRRSPPHMKIPEGPAPPIAEPPRRDLRRESERDSRGDTESHSRREPRRESERESRRDSERESRKESRRESERDTKRESSRESRRGSERGSKRGSERDSRRESERDSRRESERDSRRKSERDLKRDSRKESRREPRREEPRGPRREESRELRREEPREPRKEENIEQIREDPKDEIKKDSDRKRALEGEVGPESRDDSPGASKRVKIDRNKARGRRQEGGASRIFQTAVGGTKKAD